MRVYSYTPHVNVYVEVRQADGTDKYYDLSDDIVNVTVNRKSSAVSDFSITLQNKQRKYNGVFTPMDKVAIIVTKDEKQVRLLTGYMTTVDRFTLYENDFHIQGKCSLYQLQQFYWDPALTGSQDLWKSENLAYNAFDNNYALIWKLLVSVGGWDGSYITIQDLPQDVIDWAYGVYEADKEDMAQSMARANEFQELLRTVGPTAVGGASSKAVERAVKWAEQVAADDSIGYSRATRSLNPDVDCSSFIYFSLIKSGGWTTEQLGTYPFTTYTMDSFLLPHGWRKYTWDKDHSKLRRGDIMWNTGHTEWYIGNDQNCGAHSDYDGRHGDSSGNEVSITPTYDSFTHYYRYVGGNE